MSVRLANRIALVTGGCSGIGLATVERFLADGAQVVVADIQDEKGAALQARFPENLAFVHTDVASEEDIKAAVQTAENSFGGLDILVNNAGMPGTPATIVEITAEDWDEAQSILLRGALLGTKHAAPLMQARGGGAIINVASMAGFQAGWGLAYGVAKAGVIHLTKQAAAELGIHNIRVNAICPGVIVTPIFGVSAGLSREEADTATDSFTEPASRMQPLQRAGLPEDIANAAAYLVSDDASFVTGTHLLVDGGYSVGHAFAWDPAAMEPLHHSILEKADEIAGSDAGEGN